MSEAIFKEILFLELLKQTDYRKKPTSVAM